MALGIRDLDYLSGENSTSANETVPKRRPGSHEFLQPKPAEDEDTLLFAELSGFGHNHTPLDPVDAPLTANALEALERRHKRPGRNQPYEQPSLNGKARRREPCRETDSTHGHTSVSR